MNRATCLYLPHNAPLIELLALIDSTADGYTISLSWFERPRYDSIAMLAAAEKFPDATGNADYRIDIHSAAFAQLVSQATQAMTDASSAIHQLQELVNLAPVAPDVFAGNWPCSSGSDAVMFPYQALQPCLAILERVGGPAFKFVPVTSESHAGELHDAGIREVHFQDGHQDYLALPSSRWQHASATAATTLFEHYALITKIAGLLLCMDRPVNQLMRLLGPNQHGAPLLQALDSLRGALRHARNTSYWTRLRLFNAEIGNVRLASEFASPACHRYFTDRRRPGKTILRPGLDVPPLPTIEPVTVAVRAASLDTENKAIPILDDGAVPLDWSDWPEFPIELAPAALPAHQRSIGSARTVAGISGTAERRTYAPFHSVMSMTDTRGGEEELITEQVEEEEWEASPRIQSPPAIHALSDEITTRMHGLQATVVPGMQVGTDVRGARGAPPVRQAPSGTNPSTPSLAPPPTAWPVQTLAASLDLPGLHQHRMAQYKDVTFGKSVYLVGTPAIGSGTVVGDRAVIHQGVRLPQRSIVHPRTVLFHCKFDDMQVMSPVQLVLSGDPSGSLAKLRFIPGRFSSLVELGKIHFALSEVTYVPGGVRFLPGAVVSFFDVEQTAMNNCLVQGSLHLREPSLGVSVRFGPDVVVDAGVSIGDNVVFQGSNFVKAGSVIGESAVICKGVVVSGTVAPWAFVTATQKPVCPEISPGEAPRRLNVPMENVIATPRAGALRDSGRPQNAKPTKMIDLTNADDASAVIVLDLPASSPRASLPQAPLPVRTGASDSLRPGSQSLAMSNISHLPLVPPVSTLRAGPFPQQQLFQMLISSPVLPLVPVRPPFPVPSFPGSVSPSMRNESMEEITRYGLMHTAPPPAQATPAMPVHVPAVNTNSAPAIRTPQPFSPSAIRKPGL